MAFVTNRIQIDGSINVDGSIYQWNQPFVGGGGGGGGDVGWASGAVGSNNQLITATGDGSIYAESSLTFDGTQLNLSYTSSRINLGIGAYNGPHGLYFYDNDSSIGIQQVYRTTPEELLWEDKDENDLMSLNKSGDVSIARNLTVDSSVLAGKYNRLGAIGKQIISGSAQTSSRGLESWDTAYGETDYQYFYYNSSGHYGGMFALNGTSNSDLRSDWYYLRWYSSYSNGTSRKIFDLSAPYSSTPGYLILNDEGEDFDVRIESSGDTAVFAIDGGSDRVGIGTNSPEYKLDVDGSVRATEGFHTGNYEMVYNSVSDSLDFNYKG